MPIDFYYLYGSPPCRAVMLTASLLGVELRPKEISTARNEHLQPDFLKINPDHCLPTIVDGDFVLWESRAIMIYLAETYGKDDAIYPKDTRRRALVNRRLLFDVCEVCAMFDVVYIWLAGKTKENPRAYNRLVNCLKKVDRYLQSDKYVAGENLTLADVGLVSSISTYSVVDFDFTDYPNITRWFEMMKREIPDYEEIDGVQCKHLKVIFPMKWGKETAEAEN